MGGRTEQSAKLDLVRVIDTLLLALERRRFDRLREMLGEQQAEIDRLRETLDPTTFAGQVVARLAQACRLANPGPAATVWDVPRQAQRLPLEELLSLDATTLRDPALVEDFAEFQERLRAAHNEDAKPSDRRKFVELRPKMERLRRITAGSAEGELCTKALILIADVARTGAVVT